MSTSPRPTARFHPKLYLVERCGEVRTISGSANLTAAGWTTNVEQFEELSFPDPSVEADGQRERYELVREHGAPLKDPSVPEELRAIRGYSVYPGESLGVPDDVLLAAEDGAEEWR